MAKKAYVDQSYCVCCGACQKVCPQEAIDIIKGMYAQVQLPNCVGCGKCVKECPASTITIKEVTGDAK